MAKTKKKVAPKKKATPKKVVVTTSKPKAPIIATSTVQYVPHVPRRIDNVPPPKK